jgi:hypothetical protein
MMAGPVQVVGAEHRLGPASSNEVATWRTLPARQAVAGASIGILCIPGVSALIPGNVQNATTYDFPVLYDVLPDVTFPEIACGDERVAPKLIAGATRLVAQGCRAVVGACGSFGHYQKTVAAAIDVPVFMSILTQVPFLLQSMGPRRKLLIIFATTRAWTEKVREQCGIDPTRIVAFGLEDCPEFTRMMAAESEFTPSTLATQIIQTIAPAVTGEVGGILLQCSDLPPCAVMLQRHFGLPIYDMTGLIRWLQGCVVRRHFNGAM